MDAGAAMVEGQAVFITGAGSGLGKALAMRFAQEGARQRKKSVIAWATTGYYLSRRM